MAVSKKYIGFADFEFTCGTAKYRFCSEMLSVGVVICDTDYNVTEKFYATSKPNRYPKLSKQCRELTHLSQEEISASRDSNDVLLEVSELINRYNIKELWVWGSFDKLGLQNDIRQHCNLGKNIDGLCRICGVVKDIQDEMIKYMKLPEAISVKELASSFGYIPENGSFHNAFNDAMALYIIHKTVFTTDFKKCSAYSSLVEARIEKNRQIKAAQEEKRREIAFSIKLSEEEKVFYDKLDDKRKKRFIYIRCKIIRAFERYPQANEFAYIVIENSKKIKIISKEKADSKQYLSMFDVKYFKKENFGTFIIGIL